MNVNNFTQRHDVPPWRSIASTPRRVWTAGSCRARAGPRRRSEFQRYGRAILVKHLVDCVVAETHPVVSAEHARHALEIMLKAIESARCGRVLDLETTF